MWMAETTGLQAAPMGFGFMYDNRPFYPTFRTKS